MYTWVEMSLAYELSVNVFTVITCSLVLKVVIKILYFMVALEIKASFKKYYCFCYIHIKRRLILQYVCTQPACRKEEEKQKTNITCTSCTTVVSLHNTLIISIDQVVFISGLTRKGCLQASLRFLAAPLMSRTFFNVRKVLGISGKLVKKCGRTSKLVFIWIFPRILLWTFSEK